MNTKTPLFIVLSIGVATAMVTMSGVTGIWGMAGPADDLVSGDQLKSQAENHSLAGDDAEKPYKGQVNPEADSDITGLIIGTLPKMIGLLAVPGLLSWEMMRLGIWGWAAVPVGLLFNIVTYIGGFQLVTNRRYE